MVLARKEQPVKVNKEDNTITIETIAGKSFDGLKNTLRLESLLNEEKYKHIPVLMIYKGIDDKKSRERNCREGLPGIGEYPSLVKGTHVSVVVGGTDRYEETLADNIYHLLTRKELPKLPKAKDSEPKNPENQ